MFYLCSKAGMERIDPTIIAEAILAAPGWARVGITAPTRCLRADAAVELARSILDHIEAGTAAPQDDQIGMAL